MDEKLTPNEKHFLKDYFERADKKKFPPSISYLYAGVISVLGLILLIASVVISFKNLSDNIVYWVLIPGFIGGVIIIVFGIFLLKYFQREKEQQSVATILKKLLD